VITNVEKNLYNTYLRVTRSTVNKPFTYRKDFTDLDDSSALFLTRINTLLSKYPHITPDAYFVAPFKVYPNAEHFTLEFYANMSGVNAYSLYMKQIQEMSPDSDEQLNFITESLKFIGSFCIRNNIKVEEYPNFKTGITYDWMKHVKKHEISLYALMDFPEIHTIITKSADDEKELFLGDAGKYFLGYKTKYLQSKIAKQLVKEGLSKINKIVSLKITE
jgi:hypothetical protein